MSGNVTVSHIASWDGGSWSALTNGLDGPVEALAVFDDGSGSALYAGGQFTVASGVTLSRIGKCDGLTWTALGSGMDDRVAALSVFDDGQGPALYAGGYFTSAGGVPASFIATPVPQSEGKPYAESGRFGLMTATAGGSVGDIS